MARERKLPSTRPSNTTDKRQAKNTAETNKHKANPATESDNNIDIAAASAGDEPLDQEQGSSSGPKDDRTFAQLVKDYGDDSM